MIQPMSTTKNNNVLCLLFYKYAQLGLNWRCIATMRYTSLHYVGILRQLECGPMPNVMGVPNIGVYRPCAQRRKVWLAPTARMPYSNAANRRARDLEDAK